MIACADPSAPNPLPPPSADGGWWRTMYHDAAWATDGVTLLAVPAIVDKRVLGVIARHANWPKRKYAMDDPDAARLVRLWTESLARVGAIGVDMRLGERCVNDVRLVAQAPGVFTATVEAAHLAYAIHATAADRLVCAPVSSCAHPVVLFHGEQPVGMVARLR